MVDHAPINDTNGSFSVLFFLKSKPKEATGVDFRSLMISGGRLVIDVSDGKLITHDLSDVERVTVRPNKN